MPASWPQRHPHLTTALGSLAAMAALGALLLVAGEPVETAGVTLALVPVLFVWFELLSLAVGSPVVPAMVTGRGGGSAAPAGADGSGMTGPEWDRGGDMVDASGGGVGYGGDFGGGGGDGGGG